VVLDLGPARSGAVLGRLVLLPLLPNADLLHVVVDVHRIADEAAVGQVAVEYWTPENKNNKYPGIGLECLWTQALSQVDGTFFKIQNITLGYSLPQTALNKIRMKGLRVYLSVQNPFTFSDYLGSDPQVIGEDLSKSLSLYPMIFTCGFNLKF